MTAPGSVSAVDGKITKLVRLGIADLEQRLNVDRSTIFRWYKTGRFPEPTYLDDRRVWPLDAVLAWEAERLARPASARRGARNLAGTGQAQERR